MEQTRAQTQLLQAETNAINNPVPDVPQNPDWFTKFNHPTLGEIPVPNESLGESAEALENAIINGTWLAEIARTNPTLHKKLTQGAVHGKVNMLLQMIEAITNVSVDIKDQVQVWVKDNWQKIEMQ